MPRSRGLDAKRHSLFGHEPGGWRTTLLRCVRNVSVQRIILPRTCTRVSWFKHHRRKSVLWCPGRLTGNYKLLNKIQSAGFSVLAFRKIWPEIPELLLPDLLLQLLQSAGHFRFSFVTKTKSESFQVCRRKTFFNLPAYQELVCNWGTSRTESIMNNYRLVNYFSKLKNDSIGYWTRVSPTHCHISKRRSLMHDILSTTGSRNTSFRSLYWRCLSDFSLVYTIICLLESWWAKNNKKLDSNWIRAYPVLCLAEVRQNILLNSEVNRNTVVVAERELVIFIENVANNSNAEDGKKRTNKP